MLILGWHGSIRREHEDMAPGWSVHDGAAVLVRDGQVVAAIEEERLNRIKHSNFFPVRALKACLQIGGVQLTDIDCIAMNFEERTRDIFATDIGRPATELYLDEARRAGPTVREMISELFWEEFGVDVADVLYFYNHHLAHLWSAWGPAEMEEALVVSFDGSGDGLSGMIALGEDNAPLAIKKKYLVEQSLGNLYADTIRLIGYRRFDEYKAMGLAPYGDPRRYESLFSQFYKLLPEGDYWLADRRERWAKIYDAGLVRTARRHDQEFTALHADVAAALQDTIEKIALHVLTHFARTTGQRNLCYAGGVAHNCTLNGKILYAHLFDSVYIQPAAHDAGGALGAALAAAHEFKERLQRPCMPHVFTGRGLGSSDEVHRTLQSWRDHITVEHVERPSTVAAQLVASGQVIGWAQGRAEFGPRALGHRSILADPRPASNKDRINAMVKKRESFRPFAPSICIGRVASVFDLPDTHADYSYMTFTLSVAEVYRQSLAAITHVDGSARIQSVSRADNESYWQLISEFERITGVPAVLNTSFNNNAEPIVDSTDDIIACFLTTGLDALIIDEFVVRKRSEHIVVTLGKLHPQIAACRKLVRRCRTTRDSRRIIEYSVESTASRYFVEPVSELSESAFRVLLGADGRHTLDELVLMYLSDGASSSSLNSQFYSLWETRAISLLP